MGNSILSNESPDFSLSDDEIDSVNRYSYTSFVFLLIAIVAITALSIYSVLRLYLDNRKRELEASRTEA